MFLHSYAHARFLREFCTSLHQLLASGPSLTDINLQGNTFPHRKWHVASEEWREWRCIPTESLMPSRQQHGSSCTGAEDQTEIRRSIIFSMWEMLICVISWYQTAVPGKTSWKIFQICGFPLSVMTRFPRTVKDRRLSFMSVSCCYIIVWDPGVNRCANSVTTTRKFIIMS